ncbi:hypothetical protein VHEMI05836 [[Torrubiella] hemipterigena]|uniref:Uncharacterized protein n=1 Tax=[Torrubiella] hemipterigena TaxID=1531966 RepID=A0A0A1THM4_9HYPO|nr:hypothetical protein VHEMI05836 [[Torrubiella] hemipterigena]
MNQMAAGLTIRNYALPRTNNSFIDIFIEKATSDINSIGTTQGRSRHASNARFLSARFHLWKKVHGMKSDIS